MGNTYAAAGVLLLEQQLLNESLEDGILERPLFLQCVSVAAAFELSLLLSDAQRVVVCLKVDLRPVDAGGRITE